MRTLNSKQLTYHWAVKDNATNTTTNYKTLTTIQQSGILKDMTKNSFNQIYRKKVKRRSKKSQEWLDKYTITRLPKPHL